MELTVLGCNSATPTSSRNPSAQILTVSGRTFLIDCGEGTQFQLRKLHINFMKIEEIFISHLHGDHVFGLIGLLCTMSLFNKTTPLTIFAHPKLKEMIMPKIEFFCENISFDLRFRPLRYDKPEVLQEVKRARVVSIPLKHRIETCGFLFKELAKEPNIRPAAICKYGLSIPDIVSIKNGKPYYDSFSGEEIPRTELVFDPPAVKSYAYLSDTAYCPSVVPIIKDVSLLYHEATFGQDHQDLAKKTLHSTAHQAALIAKEANAGKLLLGHFSSRYNDTLVLEQEAQAVFPNATAVYDGFQFAF